jgi:hypothetical protein
MTEAGWLRATNPDGMLLHLRGGASDRKLRLFTAACCRRVADFCNDEGLLSLVEVAERYADGGGPCQPDRAGLERLPVRGRSRLMVTLATTLNPGAAWAGAWQVDAAAWQAVAAAGGDRDAEREAQAALLQELFGNPFKLRPTIDPSWLRWNDGVVPRLARSIYDERRFDDLPILHDALLDAGCDEQALLDHCRSPGPHARGCWVVDLLLDKE